MKKLLILLLATSALSSFSSEVYNCKDQRGQNVKLQVTGEESFQLEDSRATTIFVKTDELIDFANNDSEIIYKSESERWVENPWFGFKMYTHFKTDFEFDKTTKTGHYERYSKVGLLSRADKDKITFKCN